jgi:hypothetical protein
MHEDPIGATRVERLVGEVETMSVAEAELQRQIKPPRSPSGFEDHRLAAIHAHDTSRLPDHFCERPRIIAGPAPDIENAISCFDIQHFESPELCGKDLLRRTGLIQVTHE